MAKLVTCDLGWALVPVRFAHSMHANVYPSGNDHYYY